MLIDHVGIDVSDLARARAFYDAALGSLGAAIVQEVPGVVLGYAGAQHVQSGEASFWVAAGKGPITPVHVAFAVKDHDAVHAFHQAALGAGGRDNGGPGYRPHYHPNYYAAFVLDPDGHNIEAVCHRPAAGV